MENETYKSSKEISNYILELAKKPIEDLNPLEIKILEMAYYIIKRSKK